MVQTMGLFDEWQAQKDSQYILIVEYIEQLAKQHNSSLSATTEYLQNQHNNLDIYSKQSNGNFYKATCNFDNSTFSFDVETILREIKLFLENNQKTHAQQFSEYKLGYSFRNSNYYFKKSELPAIEPVAPSQPQKGEIKPQNAILQRDPLLTNLDIFTVIEASCLISGDDPIQISICIGDTYFRQNNIEYLKAESFISAGIKSGKLDSDITRQSLQKFLLEKGYVIEGFNDNLPPATADKIGHATITQTMPTDSQLLQQVADQQATIDQQAKELTNLKTQIEEVTKQKTSIDRLYNISKILLKIEKEKTQELTDKLASIEQAGKDTQSNTPTDGDPLALVFDSTNANYAPDLVHALNLWLDLYHRNPKDSDSHTNKANIWLKNNTAYEYVKRGYTAMNRIREIATPLKDFGQQRAKEPKK